MLIVILISCVTAPPPSLEGAELLPAQGRFEGTPPGAAMTLGSGRVGGLVREANVGAPVELAMGGAREDLGPTRGSMALDWHSEGLVWAARCEDQRGLTSPIQQGPPSDVLSLSCTLERQEQRWALELRAESERPAIGGLSMEGHAAYALQEVDIAPLQRPGPRQASWAVSLEGRSVAVIALREEGGLHLHPSTPDPELLEAAAATLLLWADPRGAAP